MTTKYQCKCQCCKSCDCGPEGCACKCEGNAAKCQCTCKCCAKK